MGSSTVWALPQEVVAVFFQRRPGQRRECVPQLGLAVGEVGPLLGVRPDRRLALRLGARHRLNHRLAVAHPKNEDHHASERGSGGKRKKRSQHSPSVGRECDTAGQGVQGVTKISLINNLPENALARASVGR